MKFFLAKNCQINFSRDAFIMNSHEKRGRFTANHYSEVESQPGDNANLIETVKDMMEIYKNVDSKGSIILTVSGQPLCQGSLRLIIGRRSLLRHLSTLCGMDNVRVTVTLENFSNLINSFGQPERGKMSTKGMAVEPKCEDTTVKFPSASVFNMFYDSSCTPSTTLTVVVEVTSAKSVLPPIQPKPCNKVYKRMLSDEIHSDVVIIAKDGGPVKCHKSVLSTCSSVFEAMFQTDMKESKTHQIEMPDMTEAGVRAFLKYIYFTSTEEPEKNCKIAFELLGAAHKYDVTPDLETEMKKLFLSKPVEWYSVDVAINVFLFARSIPSGSTMISKSVEVLKKHYSSLKQERSVLEMFQKHPEAAIELCELAFASNL